MKKKIYSYMISGSIWFLASIFFTLPLLNAQVPQSFKYQAIVRDSKGQPITNTNISLRMSILNGNKADSTVYSETFANTTSSIGLASVEFGTGIPISGSFTSINWSEGNYYLKLEVDPSGGSNWKNLGTSRLLSVPYALFAGKVSNAPKLEVTGNAQYSADSALFEVKDRNGNTVFAVYEDGAVLYVKNSGKGGRGSFAVGGRSAKKGSTIQNIMIVSPDSVRVYLNDTIIAKGGRGGFAVGGRSNAKGSGNDLLFVNPSTTNISTQGNDGSFTIDNNSGGSRDWYAHLTPNNTFLGDRSGSNTTTGADNIFIGGDAGESNTTENSNILIGNSSGQFIHGGGGNVALGNRTAMYLSNAIDNTVIGHEAGHYLSTAALNTIIGAYSAGYNQGEFNLFAGAHAGAFNKNGSNNTFLGAYAGELDTVGDGNIIVGAAAGRNHFAGNNSVIIGNVAGYNGRGDNNIFLGFAAGYDQDGSNKLVINNSATDSTQDFIWGDMTGRLMRFNSHVGIGRHPDPNINLSIFDNSGTGTFELKGMGGAYHYVQLRLASNQIPVNKYYELNHTLANSFNMVYYNGATWKERIRIDTIGHVGLGNPPDSMTQVLDVSGNARFRAIGSGANYKPLSITSNGTLTTTTSDSRLKMNITNFTGALQLVSQLQGKYFHWKNDPQGPKQIGLIAQEVEKVVPEAVFTNDVDGYKGINYNEVTAILVEAVKELQQQVESVKEENRQLKVQNEELLQGLKK